MRLSSTTSLTTRVADTPAGRGFEIETEYGGRASSAGLTETPGAMLVGAELGVGVAAGILAGGLLHAAIPSSAIPDPSPNAARRDRPQAVTPRPREP